MTKKDAGNFTRVFFFTHFFGIIRKTGDFVLKRNLRSLWAWATCLALFVLGCGREDAVLKDGCVSPFEAPRDTVLMRVNGREITVGDYLNRFELETAIYRFKHKARQDERAECRFREARAGQILPQLVNLSLVKEYLQKNKVAAGTNEEALVRQFVRGLDKKADFDKIARELGTAPAYLREQILFPEWAKNACEHFDPSCRSVSEQEIDEGRARQDRYYERAVASNKWAWACCSNALAAVRGGMDFKLAGRKFATGDKDEAEAWDAFEPDDIENAQLKAWAFSAPVGAVGGPFDIEDGLCLVKILSRKDGTMADSVVSEGVAEVRLARINFNMVVEEPEPRTRDFVRGALLKWKAERAQKNLFEKLHREMRVEYPHGTNFTFKGEMGK